MFVLIQYYKIHDIGICFITFRELAVTQIASCTGQCSKDMDKQNLVYMWRFTLKITVIVTICPFA